MLLPADAATRRTEEDGNATRGQERVIYWAGGAIGGTVARAFAGEGARVFLAGRTLAKVEAAAGDLRRRGNSRGG